MREVFVPGCHGYLPLVFGTSLPSFLHSTDGWGAASGRHMRVAPPPRVARRDGFNGCLAKVGAKAERGKQWFVCRDEGCGRMVFNNSE